MNWLIILFIRPLAVVGVAWLLLKLFRVQHPASQHAVWTWAVVGMVGIVPLSLAVPRWHVALLPLLPANSVQSLHAMQPPEPVPAAPDKCTDAAPTSAAATLPPPAAPHRAAGAATWLLLIYFAGLLTFAGWQLAGWLHLSRLVRRSKPLRNRLLESADLVVPATVGFRRPVVVLPPAWRKWTPDKRRAVLRHEFAHLRRGDLRIAMLLGCARMLLWFHPFVWLVARKVAALAEMSCDACVVEAQANPAAYCRLLLEFTEQVARAGQRAVLPVLAMVGPSTLEQRIDRVFAVSRGGLRKLARPRLVLALGMAPALCLAAGLHLSGSAIPAWQFAPLQVLMSLEGEHIGKLSPELVPGETGQTLELLPALPAEREAIPAQLSPEDRVFTGTTFLIPGQNLKLALIEPAQGQPYVFADVNVNGKFDPDERFTFGPTQSHRLLDWPNYPETILRVALPVGPYSNYPIRLVLPEAKIYKRNSDGKGGRTLSRSPFVFVTGTVEIGGAPVLVKYMFDLEKKTAYPDYGWQGVDCNSDGWIDETDQQEFTLARDESVIFHVNGRDISTVSLDLKTGTFVVKEHPAGDNQRIALREGNSLPDFAFTDLDGKAHHFSEFRGNYVLLDFWGTWCGSCRRELPDLEKAYQQFRSRHFVILGMGDDKDVQEAREVLSAAGVTYPQSSGQTGNDLVYKRFRISAFPSKVLVNPGGKIIALEHDYQFRGGNLTATLEKFLPQEK